MKYLKSATALLHMVKNYNGGIRCCVSPHHFYNTNKFYSTAPEHKIDLKVKDVSLNKYISSIQKEFEEMCKENNFGSSSRYLELKPIIQMLEERQVLVDNINNLKELLEGQDEEINKLAEEEKRQFVDKIKEVDEKLLEIILPVDKQDLFDSIVLEVQSGVGGQEAMLFAKEMFDMYCNFAEFKGWDLEIAEYLSTDIGGIRFASALISGPSVFRIFKYEAGVHRVQRTPATEKAGRIHTSTVSVVALPQPSDIDINIQPKDLKIETKRSTGAGGQHVNTTDSAVRIVHLPTNISVECQTDRSQIKNKKYAMARLKAMLYQKELDSQTAETEAKRKIQVRSNNRNEKIRTYNFNQDRITDHRLQSANFHNLKGFMEGGQSLEQLINMLDDQYKVDCLMEIVNKYK